MNVSPICFAQVYEGNHETSLKLKSSNKTMITLQGERAEAFSHKLVLFSCRILNKVMRRDRVAHDAILTEKSQFWGSFEKKAR